MKDGALVMLALLTFAGCSALSSPGASPVFTPEGECVRAGGIWQRVPNVCEYNFSALPPLHHPPPAVDQDRLPRDVARVVAREQRDDAGHVVRLRHVAHRHRAPHLVDDVLRQAVVRARADRARTDDVGKRKTADEVSLGARLASLGGAI